MTQVNIRISDDLREQVKQVAAQQRISLNQFCATAIARAVGESRAHRFFAQRAGGLSPEEGRRRFATVLDKVKK